jgi:ABC-type amino acid transport substrate-binding protein
MIPLVIARTTDSTLMDVPVALVALEKWPGEIKVVGPISLPQEMAPAFAKSSPKLRAAFEAFFERSKADGSYNRLVNKYYPTVFTYYPDFF